MNARVTRGMDLPKYLKLAEEFGCVITPPGNNDTHYRLNHPANPGRELSLAPKRKDTPWVSLQWLRRVEQYVQRAGTLTRAVRDGSAMAAATSHVLDTAPPLPRTAEEVMAALREVKAEVVDAKQRIAKAAADLQTAEVLVAETTQAQADAATDQAEAEKSVPVLLRELDEALEREAASPDKGNP